MESGIRLYLPRGIFDLAFQSTRIYIARLGQIIKWYCLDRLTWYDMDAWTDNHGKVSMFKPRGGDGT